ncbi:MAG: (2Fe-2S)-binding protein [Coriobacteriales bacterium]|jgi:NADH dehydrogenase/NADH:ubiquinone oxidoreductase subunit G|nr:(2Fe-2S)-binding protein [Coriobacteriales bacterium]
MSITITIDGKPCVCEPGEYVLEIARRNGIFVPALCSLKPVLTERGCCRVCIVELVEDARSKVVVSCIYPVERECEVFTQSEKIVRERGMILALLKLLAPDATLIAQLAKAYRAPDLDRLEPNPEGGTCVLCGRCVEACSLLGTSSLAAVNRGVSKEIATAYHAPSATCIGCASCAGVCPTDAIPVVEDGAKRTIWNKDFELAYCEVCGELLGTVASLEHAATAAEVEPLFLCPVHKQKVLAQHLAHPYKP